MGTTVEWLVLYAWEQVWNGWICTCLNGFNCYWILPEGLRINQNKHSTFSRGPRSGKPVSDDSSNFPVVRTSEFHRFVSAYIYHIYV